MLARCTTYLIDGVNARRVTVECNIRPGLPSFTILGLSDGVVRDLRAAVRAALQAARYPFPEQRVTLNIAPARLRGTFPSLGLSVAAAVLAASGEIPAENLAGAALYGRLAADGTVELLCGTLAVALEHRSSSPTDPLLYAGPTVDDLARAHSRVITHLSDLAAPRSESANACEDAGISTAASHPVDVGRRMRAGDDASRALGQRFGRTAVRQAPYPGAMHGPSAERWPVDYADLRGHADAIYALTVAAAGGHSILLRGGPGSGATMLARRLVTILPEPTAEQEREISLIRDVAGLDRDRRRPFRAPHHTISPAGLVGGGCPPRPGEITLATHGVLFLDQLDQFSRPALEALRAPLRDGHVDIARGEHTTRFPADCLLVASASPCPCGHGATERCLCDSHALTRHQRRLSASLLERFAIIVDLSTTEQEPTSPMPPSEVLREFVRAARERRDSARQAAGHDAHSRGEADRREPVVHPRAWGAFYDALSAGSLSHRSGAQVLAVAQTIADLAGEDAISLDAMTTALGFGGNRISSPSQLAR